MPKKLYEGGPLMHPKQSLESAYKEQGADTKASRATGDEAGLMARTTTRLGSNYAQNYKGVAASGPAKAPSAAERMKSRKAARNVAKNAGQDDNEGQ